MRQQQLFNNFWLVGVIGVLVAQPVKAEVTQANFAQLKPTPYSFKAILEFVLNQTDNPATTAQLNPTQKPVELDSEISPDPQAADEVTEEQPQQDEEADIEIEVTGEREPFSQTSSPEYVITEEEIQKQGSNSLAETLRNLPGFAINDAGFGADIHTDTPFAHLGRRFTNRGDSQWELRFRNRSRK